MSSPEKKDNDKSNKLPPATTIPNETGFPAETSVSNVIDSLVDLSLDDVSSSSSTDNIRKPLTEGPAPVSTVEIGQFSESEDESLVNVLSEFTLDGIIKYIKEKKCKNIITLAGAGISTSAGIPDFRSPGSGLYYNLQKYKLPHPQAIFEIGYFQENPQPFFILAKELYPGNFKPTICHYFVRLIAEKGLLLRHYTQNIDTLERVAKIPHDKIVEAHGTFHLSHCIYCRKEYSMEWMKEKIFADVVPTCQCGGIIKPDIVFFGENLPERFYKLTYSDFKKCDLLIILGSSLAVQPFASLLDRVNESCPRILINREKCGQSIQGANLGLEYDLEYNTRDVFMGGDCDESCLEFAEKLGWKEELLTLVKKEHNIIDKQNVDEKSKTKEWL